MKKLFAIMLCSVMIITSQSTDVSAEHTADHIKTMNYQNESPIMPMREDVIEYRYRQYKNRLQYRRWNVTKECWVDSHWINV